jgi:hypothetical protein
MQVCTSGFFDDQQSREAKTVVSALPLMSAIPMVRHRLHNCIPAPSSHENVFVPAWSHHGRCSEWEPHMPVLILTF